MRSHVIYRRRRNLLTVGKTIGLTVFGGMCMAAPFAVAVFLKLGGVQ